MVVESMLLIGVMLLIGAMLLIGVLIGDIVAVGFTIVVLLPAGEEAGVTVSVRCSHPARRAALAKTQIYFFIIFSWVAR